MRKSNNNDDDETTSTTTTTKNVILRARQRARGALKNLNKRHTSRTPKLDTAFCPIDLASLY